MNNLEQVTTNKLGAAIQFLNFYPNFNIQEITLIELLVVPTSEYKSKISVLSAKRQKQGQLCKVGATDVLRYIELVAIHKHVKTCIKNCNKVLFGHRYLKS